MYVGNLSLEVGRRGGQRATGLSANDTDGRPAPANVEISGACIRAGWINLQRHVDVWAAIVPVRDNRGFERSIQDANDGVRLVTETHRGVR